jgi:hypothetical protein
LKSRIAEAVATAKASALADALACTESTLAKLIAVPAVELLQAFPANLWQQLHTVRKQVGCTCLAAVVADADGQKQPAPACPCNSGGSFSSAEAHNHIVW